MSTSAPYLQALAPTRGREGEQAPRVKVALLTDESYGRSSRLDFLANAADRGTGTVGFGRWSTTRTGN